MSAPATHPAAHGSSGAAARRDDDPSRRSAAGAPLRYVGQGRNLPLYVTDRPCRLPGDCEDRWPSPCGPFLPGCTPPRSPAVP